MEKDPQETLKTLRSWPPRFGAGVIMEVMGQVLQAEALEEESDATHPTPRN